MQLFEIAARESIRDLVARFNASGDAGRFDETLALFAPDAVLEILPDRRYQGHDEIRALFEGAAESTTADAFSAGGTARRFLRHFTATHQIDLLDLPGGFGDRTSQRLRSLPANSKPEA